jgi:hypothetical protein
MSTRPTTLPDWATNANFGAGVNPWNAQPNKAAPSAGLTAEGFDPQSPIAAEWINFLFNNHAQWIDYLDANQGSFLFGDGSDGTVTIDGTVAAPAGMSKSGSTYTLTRDFYAANLTITGVSTVLQTVNFRLFVNGTLTTVGGASINNDGLAASGQTGGVQRTGGTLSSTTAGANGGNVNVGGSNASNQTNSYGGAGGNGGASVGAAGTGGTTTAPAATLGAPRVSDAQNGYLFGPPGSPAVVAIVGGAGGGGGGGSGANVGGGGGGGGGILVICARFVALAAAGDIHANGGAGSNGTALSGGGGGGGGGVLILAYWSKSSGLTFTAATNCAAGTTGSGGSGGSGTAGGSGTVFELAASSGSAPSTTAVHTEAFVQSITAGSGANHEFVDLTFATAFGDTLYTVERIQIEMTTDGDPAVGWYLSNKLTTSVRVRFSSDFAGTLRITFTNVNA